MSTSVINKRIIPQLDCCRPARPTASRQTSNPSVIFFIMIQMTLIRYSSTQQALKTRGQATRLFITESNNHIMPQVHPLNIEDTQILDVNSLYKTSSTSRYKRSTANVAAAAAAASKSIVDVCQSKMEVLTPYYATNSKGKLRTIVNSELLQQAIQVETCLRSSTMQSKSASDRCNAQNDCGCEQKYKWHRLLVLDPSGESSTSNGLFMDWFLFPSNCVCRCKSGPSSARHFLKTITNKP